MLAPKQIKKTILCFLFSSLFFAGLSTADVYLVIGDSLSAAYNMPKEQGWVALLEKELKQQDEKSVVINESISGDHARRRAKCKLVGEKTCLLASLKKHSPDWVILELGGNDALSLAPVKDIHRSLEKMIMMSIKRGAKVVLVGINIPSNVAIPEKLRKEHGEQAVLAYLKQFNLIYPRLAETYGIRFAPNILAGILNNPDLMQPDGIHANTKAQPLIKNHILKAMNQTPE